MAKPRLALPLGDPAGIGTEVVLKAIADPQIRSASEVVVIGTRSLLQQTYDQLRSLHPTQPLAHPDQLDLIDVPLAASLVEQIHIGQGNAASGAASFQYLITAITQARLGEVQGLVTAPIAKSAWKAAGHEYPGQTELLAEQAGVDRVGMLFVARSPHTGWTLRTLLATTHIPLAQVAATLTPALMSQKLELLITCLRQDFGLIRPRIAIAGLNPHSGEQGQLGREEVDWLLPWLTEARKTYPDIHLEGLVPPDTLWVKPGQSWFRGLQAENAHDAYLALYHDQGLIPVKLMAFDRAVNTSIGLPFVRTSPDHGTAFDIAGRGIADATSMQAALALAVELCQKRQGVGKRARIELERTM